MLKSSVLEFSRFICSPKLLNECGKIRVRCLLTRSLANVDYRNFNRNRNMSGTNSADSEQDISKAFLDLEKLDKNLYRSRHLLPGLPTSPRVYGGLVIGQALVAASETVNRSYHIHSLHCYFIKAGDVKIPILYQVDPVRDGNSFTTRCVKAIQHGDAIFTCQVSFHKEEETSIKHQATMPHVKPPEECKDIGSIFKEALSNPDLAEKDKKRIAMKLKLIPVHYESRPVDSESCLLLQPRPPKFMYWMKPKGHIGNDSRLHHCVAAYLSDAGMIGAALMPNPSVITMSSLVVSLDHAMWFHSSQLNMDDWMLYELESTIADSGRAFIMGRLWSREGVLRVSTAQEGLIRKSKL